mmetsp:Transcript_23399/g.54357  ORF Transcript_23399/g.54357 Transcript_23399/m.54357 type:complete len:84 (+) Transcript_23399:49-300(+)
MISQSSHIVDKERISRNLYHKEVFSCFLDFGCEQKNNMMTWVCQRLKAAVRRGAVTNKSRFLFKGPTLEQAMRLQLIQHHDPL